MAPPARLWTACRSLAARARPAPHHRQALAHAPRRHLSDEAGKGSKDAMHDDFAAMLGKANAEGPMEAHGLTPAQEGALYEGGVIPPAPSGNAAVDGLREAATGLKVVGAAEGSKFPLPELPLPWYMQMKNRYHPVLAQISRLLMKDGKLSKAQSVRFPLVSLVPFISMAIVIRLFRKEGSRANEHRTSPACSTSSAPPRPRSSAQSTPSSRARPQRTTSP